MQAPPFHLASLIILSLALVCGCSKKGEMRFKAGSGDAGQFIVQQAVARGARLSATNGLPAISGAWRYAEDQYGVTIRLPPDDYDKVEATLRQLFGEPIFGPSATTDGGQLGGYRLSAQGGAIQFASNADCAQVIIVRPLTRREAASDVVRALQEMRKGETP